MNGSTGDESASETTPSPADRSSAGRTKNRTIPGAITDLLKAAAKAIMRRDPDAPKPRKRREGEKAGQIMQPRRAIKSRPSARSRYAALQPVKTMTEKTARKSARPTNGTAAPDIYEEAEHYLADTLAVLYQWNDEALAETFDDYCSDRHTYPSLGL